MYYNLSLLHTDYFKQVNFVLTSYTFVTTLKLKRKQVVVQMSEPHKTLISVVSNLKKIKKVKVNKLKL